MCLCRFALGQAVVTHESRPEEPKMPKAVRFEQYGGIDVLNVVEVPRPVPGDGEVLVRVRAAGINPGEAAIRSGALHSRWPTTFPSGQGSDLAGTIEEVGSGVTSVSVGEEILGFTDKRASHAEYVLVEATNAVPRPARVSWEEAGALFVAGSTAWAAARAVAPTAQDTVVVSAAAGGVGCLAVQLARRTGATVIGLAGQANHAWLIDHDVIPVSYEDGVADRIRQAARGKAVDAFIDTFGAGYVELALELGVKPDRIDTIANFAAIEKYGVKSDGNAAGGNATVLAELADLIGTGQLDLPIAGTYPLDRVRDAFADLERRHTRGKIVLLP
jgi:NADPH:quinone reductase-like Zn-dependent oxidoreductase